MNNPDSPHDPQDVPAETAPPSDPAPVDDGGQSVPAAANDATERRRAYGKFVAVLLVAAVIGQIVCWMTLDATFRVMSVLYIWPATLFLTLLWWTFLSHQQWRVRLRGLGTVCGLVIAFFLAVRIQGCTGDMVPVLAWRWTPSAEEVSAAYWSQLSDRSTSNTAAAGVTGEEGSDAEAPPVLEVASDDWPEFRGPQRDGIVRNTEIRTDWNEHPPELVWKHAVGPAWSSFAIIGEYAFTQEQRGEKEAVVCYDALTGEQTWAHTDEVRFEEALGGIGPRATPTIHQSRLYALGATGLLNCLDALTGKAYWRRNILEDAGVENISWAMSGSPLVVDDLVIVNPGGDPDDEKPTAVAAYHRLTGDLVWAAGDQPASYSGARLETIDGVRQLLVFHGTELAGHAVDDGRVLWRFPWTNDPQVNTAQPILLPDETLFISSGYGKGSARLEIARAGDQWKATPRWERPNEFKLKFNDGVLKDGYVYGLDEGILACVSIDDGSRQWKRGRFGYGQLLLIDQHLVILGEKGEVALVEATPERFHQVAEFDALEGITWNHPVIHRGRLYVRNASEAACFDLRAAEKK